MPFRVQHPKTGQVFPMENEQEAAAAVDKGFIPLDVRKVDTGEIFPMESADDVSTAVKSQKYELAFKPKIPEPQKQPQRKPMGALEAASITFDPTFGFKDEIWGALAGIYDPNNFGGTFSERYEKYRDAQRAAVEQARMESPKAAAATETLSSIPSLLIPGGAGVKAARAGLEVLGPVARSSVLMAATEGAGRSTAKPGSEEFAKDVAGSAVMGAALPLGIKGAQVTTKAVGATAGLVKSLPALWRGGIAAKGQAIADASSDIFKTFGADKALLKAAGLSKDATEAQIKAKIFSELEKEGSSPFKKWLAGEIAVRSGATGTAAQIENLFNLGSKRRIAGREFGPEQQRLAAEELTDALQAMEENIKTVRGGTFGEGMKLAAEEFKALPKKQVNSSVDRLRQEALDLIPGEGEVSLLTNAGQEEIMQAMRTIYQGDIKGLQKAFPNVKPGANPNQEQLFWRLQAARQIIDRKRKRLGREGFDEQATIMEGFRSAIDDVLKMSPTKEQIDVQYREGAKAVGPVFGKKSPIKTTEEGARFIEPAKVQARFAATRTGEMFERRMDSMQDFLEKSGLPFDPEITAETFKKWKNIKSTAADRRLVDSMKRAGGPSAQAIETLAGKNARNIAQEIIVRPSAVVQMIDEQVAARGGTFSEKELSDLSKWRSGFDTLAKQGAKGVLPSNAWALALSFAASKLGAQYIRQQFGEKE
jgi:hypothetical protein